MKYALAKARQLAVALGLNPELEAGAVHEFEQLVREVLNDAHAAIKFGLSGKHERHSVLAAVKNLADKEVDE